MQISITTVYRSNVIGITRGWERGSNILKETFYNTLNGTPYYISPNVDNSSLGKSITLPT